ncbi:MAG: hypothetical protein RR893_14035, partial [Clostridia bacterium]
MKRTLSLILSIILLLALPTVALAQGAETFDQSKLIDWFTEGNSWMTVANGHWSSDPADRITDEELARIFSMSMKQQCAVQW